MIEDNIALDGAGVDSAGPVDDLNRLQDRRGLTASLRVRPGHSGGPMVDSQGRLVGINTIMAGPNVGVAVPVGVGVQAGG